MIDERTAKCIRMAMEKKGISGKKLAEELGVTPTTISRWRERGCFAMSIVEDIAGQCDMTFDELMGLSE